MSIFTVQIPIIGFASLQIDTSDWDEKPADAGYLRDMILNDEVDCRIDRNDVEFQAVADLHQYLRNPDAFEMQFDTPVEMEVDER